MDQTRSDIAHLYRRAGFGARPDELDQAVKHGYRATVEALLAGLPGPDPAGDKLPRPAFTSPYPPAGGLQGRPGPADAAAKMAANRQRRADQRQQYQALQQWWLHRMIVTDTPLREKLALIWHGHFATSFEKVRDAGFMYRQNQLLRTLGGGSFEVLTQAVAKDPAMMLWLDTQTDVVGHPNENFARELIELFTIGIGNYTEPDVQAAARAFTGWGFVPQTGEYLFRPRRHDDATKSFLGQQGDFDGTDIVRIATHHPVSARFIVAKLWSHLAYPAPPSHPIIVQLATGYAADLDIAKLLRAIFLHPEFTGATARNGLVKQPIEFAVGMARAFGLDAELRPPVAAAAASVGAGPVGAGPAGAGPAGAGPAGAAPVAQATNLRTVLVNLAQEPFNPPSVGGWPQNEYWLNTATSLTRLRLGLAVGSRIDLSWLSAMPANQRLPALAAHLSIDGWGQTTTAALNHVSSDPKVLVGLALSAPEYVIN